MSTPKPKIKSKTEFDKNWKMKKVISQRELKNTIFPTKETVDENGISRIFPSLILPEGGVLIGI